MLEISRRLGPLLAIVAMMATGGVGVLQSTAAFTDTTQIPANTFSTQSCQSNAYRDALVLPGGPPNVYLRLSDAAGSSAATDDSGDPAWSYQGLALGQYRRDGGVFCDTDKGIRLVGAAASGNSVVSPTKRTRREFSAVFWVSTTTISGGRIFGALIQDRDLRRPEREVWMTDDGRIAAATSSSTGALQLVRSTAAVNDGLWHMVAVTYERDTALRLYVDGQPVDSVTPASGWTNSDRVTYSLGHSPDAAFAPGLVPSDSGISGGVDEVALWDRTLTPGEISTLAAASRP